jgi:GNAT superfamily N-acetyltransferase
MDVPQVAESGKMGTLRRLALDDMNAAARVHRSAFDDALPWLAGLHTPEEDAWFYRERVFAACEVWGAFGAEALVGVVAFRPGWIDQLYVLRAAQRGGIGTALLRAAQEAQDRLSLWTFQRNTPARRFYEARGFRPIRETDGAGNEEKEPDVLYLWTRSV